jgi:hypothetical protein
LIALIGECPSQTLLTFLDECPRIFPGVIDGTGRVHDAHRAFEGNLVGGLRGENLAQLGGIHGMLERMHGDERAFAFGDIAAEILALGLLAADEVEQVILDLEGETRLQPEGAQALDLLLRTTAYDGADRQGNPTCEWP